MSSLRFEDYERLIHKLSRKGYARLKAAGVAIEYEDVFQEFSMSWVKARDGFNPNLGFKFTTYFVNGAWVNFNRFADSQRIDMAHKTRSLDAPINSNRSEVTLAEVIADDEPNSEDRVTQREHERQVLRQLSPLTRKVVETIENPPPEFLREFKALQTRIKFGRQAGINGSQMPHEMGLGFIMRLMGLSTPQRGAVRRELEFVARG